MNYANRLSTSSPKLVLKALSCAMSTVVLTEFTKNVFRTSWTTSSRTWARSLERNVKFTKKHFHKKTKSSRCCAKLQKVIAPAMCWRDSGQEAALFHQQTKKISIDDNFCNLLLINFYDWQLKLFLINQLIFFPLFNYF